MAGRPAPQPAFDDHHPPDPDLLADCVHCGFCLPSCPTYALWTDEMDSPRGRIYLMAEGQQGEPLSASMVEHFDRCLGCMACVAACPSGVRYDRLIEATRAQVERRAPRPLAGRAVRAAVFAVFPYPRRLRAVAAGVRLYQRSGLQWLARRTGVVDRLPAALVAMERLAPPPADRRARPRPWPGAGALPARTPAQGPRRAVVALLTGCAQDVFFPQVNAATVRVLAAEGCDVVVPAGQGCCGALSLHAGREPQALGLARRTVDAFSAARVDAVVVNAAGCGSVLKDYAYLLRDDPRYAGPAAALAAKVRDVTELLTELGPVAPRHPLDVTVAYHDACHLGHAQAVREQPRDLLRSVPGLTLREVTEGEFCCGSAGVYNILQPGPAAELGARKARHVAATGADLLVTGNPGCLLQIGRALDAAGTPMPAAHTVEVIDAAIRGLPAAALCGRR